MSALSRKILLRRIKRELTERTNSILTNEQYTKLRKSGKSVADVAAFEKELDTEMEGEGADFIPTYYVELRLKGRKAKDIGYDESHIFR